VGALKDGEKGCSLCPFIYLAEAKYGRNQKGGGGIVLRCFSRSCILIPGNTWTAGSNPERGTPPTVTRILAQLNTD